MSDIRRMLEAYSSGQTDFSQLIGQIRAQLKQAPDTAPDTLRHIIETGQENKLPPAEYSSLTALVQSYLEYADTGTGAGEAATEMATEANPATAEPIGTVHTATTTSDVTDTPTELPTIIREGVILKNRFVLENLIGRGGMGKVFKARDMRKEEVRDRDPYIAVKILSEGFKDHPEAFIALAREAKKAQQLAHPNIVTVYDFDRDEDNVFMTMEYLKGEPLSRITKRVRGEGMEVKQAMDIIAQMGEALAYAHKRHIIHSDFKPGNVYVTDDKGVKVLDFGIARAAKNPNQAADATIFDAASLGALTPAYASIEMMEGDDPDPRDDIYALACVSYELLQGKHPFDKTPALQAKIRELVPEPIKGLNKKQWKAMLRGLEFDRENRTPSAHEFVNDLIGRRENRPMVWLASAALFAALVGSISYLARPPSEPATSDTPEEQPVQQAPIVIPEPIFDPEPEPVVLDDEDRSKIDRLLLIGEAHMLVGRLVEPPGSSAYDAFQEVLSIDPHNSIAQDGLVEISNQLYDLALSHIAEGDIEHGKQVIEVGLRVNPRHAELRKLKALHP